MDSILAIVQPYSRTQDQCQSYFRSSIEAGCAGAGIAYREDGPPFRAGLRFLGRVRGTERFTGIVPLKIRNPILDGFASLFGVSPRGNAVGQYTYTGPAGQVKFCIDAEDSGDLAHPDLLEWSDLYFKTNYWPARTYPSKVRPLANVNPLVLWRSAELRALRNVEPEWDVFGFFRIWGRIDHNLALFEALACLKCRTKLIGYIISADYKGEAARLEKAGISWIRHPMPLSELWQTAAKSRLNIVRHGVEDCIPWRMTDMLAMGHCPVLDYSARTEWHVPLIEDVHYLSLGVHPEEGLSPEESAHRVVERVEGWLAHKGLIDEIARNAGKYFDENLTREKLGQYIVEQVRKAGTQPGS